MFYMKYVTNNILRVDFLQLSFPLAFDIYNFESIIIP